MTSDCTIVTSGHHGSIRSTFISNNNITQRTYNRKYTWLPFMLLSPSGYSIWGTENWNYYLFDSMIVHVFWEMLSKLSVTRVGFLGRSWFPLFYSIKTKLMPSCKQPCGNHCVCLVLSHYQVFLRLNSTICTTYHRQLKSRT